ncbi:outer membrane lipoprotein carrier protein LolA, partial [Olleya sp. Ti.3.14]|uniref:LolA family protein n=1 Tax=Olleya sp. Ti.3.14 TaxID=3121297 RepID=UPI003121DE56
MKKFLVLFLLATSSIFAQDDQANKLLNEVSNKAKGYNNISIAFKYVLENTEENIKQETKGDVVMECDKYRLNILG